MNEVPEPGGHYQQTLPARTEFAGAIIGGSYCLAASRSALKRTHSINYEYR
jgi:hypothetical protein